MKVQSILLFVLAAGAMPSLLMSSKSPQTEESCSGCLLNPSGGGTANSGDGYKATISLLDPQEGDYDGSCDLHTGGGSCDMEPCAPDVYWIVRAPEGSEGTAKAQYCEQQTAPTPGTERCSPKVNVNEWDDDNDEYYEEGFELAEVDCGKTKQSKIKAFRPGETTACATAILTLQCTACAHTPGHQ